MIGRKGHMTILVAASLMFASCTVNQIDDPHDPKAIVFDVAATPCTKADDSRQKYPEDVPFGVWAYDSDTQDSYLENSKVTMGEDNLWGLDNGAKWPDSQLDFYAYSPYGRALFSDEEGVIFKGYDIEEGHDLMYTDPIVSLNNNDSHGIVPIQFKRALSMVKISARATLLDYGQFKLKGLYIGDVVSEGDFQALPSPRWIPGQKKEEFCFFEGETILSEQAVAVGEALYMIPQASEVVFAVLCDVITGDVVLRDQTLKIRSSIRWNPGKIEAYVLKIDARLNLSVENDNS